MDALKRPDVAILVGSLRQGSYSRRVAQTIVALAEQAFTGRFVEIRDLPLYDADLDDVDVEAYAHFRAAVRSADALLIVSPEYNRSIPGVLKNALDVGSRPPGQNAFRGKRGAVVSTSAGMLGGFGAQHHLRQVLVSLDVLTMTQPEVYVGQMPKLFDEQGALTDTRTRDVLTKFVASFATFIADGTRA